MLNKIKFSFEFFPPNNKNLISDFYKSVDKLSDMNPEFVSITYGAGGGTRNTTQGVIKRIVQKTDLKVASHLTCIGFSKKELTNIAKEYWDMGVKHIVALRGDISNGYNHHKDELLYANQLVAFLKNINDFEISVAGYPEKHPEAKTLSEDIDNLQKKIDAGADRVITQFFFDNNKFYDFCNEIAKRNIRIPIIPGICPIFNFQNIVKFAQKCQTYIPKNIHSLFDKEIDIDEKNQLAIDFAVEQCQDLIKNGFYNLHFYTLNKPSLIKNICDKITPSFTN